MNLYNKHRPTSLDQIKGNAETVTTLEKMLSDIPTCPHVFLLHGETGCGKTTLARIIANRLGCVGNDYKEVNSADLRGIDNIRDIIKNSSFMPIEGTTRVWVLDEVHQITKDAANSLLKILEDTPTHVYFILCTTDPQKLLATIKGRCSSFQVLALNDSQMLGLLRKIVREEGKTLEKEVYEQIIASAKGLPRNALTILEQVLAVPEDKQLALAKKAEAEIIQAYELCKALIRSASWSVIAEILTGIKDQDAEGIRRMVLSYCQTILLSGKDTPICGLIMEEFREPFYDTGFPGLTLACYSVFKNN